MSNLFLPNNASPNIAVKLTQGMFSEDDPLYVKLMGYIQRQEIFQVMEATIALVITRRPRDPYRFIAETLTRASAEHQSETESLLDVFIRCSTLDEKVPVGASTYEKGLALNTVAYDRYLDDYKMYDHMCQCLKKAAMDDRTGSKGELAGLHCVLTYFREVAGLGPMQSRPTTGQQSRGESRGSARSPRA